MKLLVAFATDNGKTYMDRHFGDAEYYYIYEITKNDYLHKKTISNVNIEEEGHADPKKAKGITSLLKQENCNVVVSKIFGANIKRIRKQFVCIMMNDNDILDSINMIKSRYDEIVNELNKGEERLHLNFKK